MNRAEGYTSHRDTIGDVLSYLWDNKWWWLSPMILILIAFVTLLMFTHRAAVAPFNYKVF